MGEKAFRRLKPATKTASVRAKPTISKLKMIVIIVNRGKGNFFLDVLEQFPVNFQMMTVGSGTVRQQHVTLLDYVENEKDILFSVVAEDHVAKVMRTLDEKFETVRGCAGVAFAVPFSSVMGVSTYRFLSDSRGKGE